MLYCDVLFPRGSGLGTRLFPWARSTIFAHVNKVPMLAPQWVLPRIGPLLRGGIDLSAYHRQILLLGLFKTKADYVVGLKRLYVHARARREAEPKRTNGEFLESTSNEDHIITFSDCRGLFAPLNGWDALLHDELRAITQPRWLELVDSFGEIPIGINVRLGNDFKSAQSSQEYFNKGAIKTPLQWYVDCLQLIRNRVGFPVKAFVVSDGTREQLKPLLDLEDVVFVRPGCAISDLLLLARAQVLIAAGGSSFSAWAAFLGQMPAISHPGQPLTWFGLANRLGYYVGEFDPTGPNEVFLEQSTYLLRQENQKGKGISSIGEPNIRSGI